LPGTDIERTMAAPGGLSYQLVPRQCGMQRDPSRQHEPFQGPRIDPAIDDVQNVGGGQRTIERITVFQDVARAMQPRLRAA
jgi:hypothetical protein